LSKSLNPRDNLKPKNLNGISDKQIDFHFDTHYKGYVTKYNEIQEKLASADRSKANQNFSEYRALKVEESFNYMGVVLHELYFENLGAKGSPSPDLKAAVEKAFGSMEKCQEELKASGIGLRGWALLSCDLFSGELVVNGLDAHNLYGYVGSLPLIVLDVYEHAYYVDQGPKRPPYIENFFGNLNWDAINARFVKCKKACEAIGSFIG
jgi:Fe-Mn family superoxide dismutase